MTEIKFRIFSINMRIVLNKVVELIFNKNNLPMLNFLFSACPCVCNYFFPNKFSAFKFKACISICRKSIRLSINYLCSFFSILKKRDAYFFHSEKEERGAYLLRVTIWNAPFKTIFFCIILLIINAYEKENE